MRVTMSQLRMVEKKRKATSVKGGDWNNVKSTNWFSKNLPLNSCFVTFYNFIVLNIDFTKLVSFIPFEQKNESSFLEDNYLKGINISLY